MSVPPVSLGYLCPDPSRINAAEPDVTYGHAGVVVNGYAGEWDYNAEVRVEWKITADLFGIRADCGLDNTARIDAVISWHSTWTNLRGAGHVTPVVDGENALGVEIPGEMLGGTLNLAVTVVLGEAGPGVVRPSPHRPGSPLWTRRSAVILEGAAARMPVMAIDFAATGRGRELGLWLLECEPDLAASVAGGVLLYLNTAHPDVQNLLDRPADTAAVALARFITYDVTRQLIARALRHDELDERHHYDRGTVGDLFLTLLRSHLPGRSLDQLRREFEVDPGEVEAELLSKAWKAAT